MLSVTRFCVARRYHCPSVADCPFDVSGEIIDIGMTFREAYDPSTYQAYIGEHCPSTAWPAARHETDAVPA